MKLKIPKIRKRTVSSKPSARKIAKRLKRGYKARKRLKGRGKIPGKPELPPYGYGMPQKLDIELKEKEKKGLLEEEELKEGVSIPSGKDVHLLRKYPMLMDTEELHRVNIKYPLIPPNPKQGETVLAYAHIKWDEKLGSLVYQVVEPVLTPDDNALVENVKRDIEERLDVDFSRLGEIRAKELLSKEVKTSLGQFSGVNPAKVPALQYHIEKEIFGLGVIEPLMQDPEIEDISCDGVNIPVYIYHRNPKLGPLRTNLLFDNAVELDGFILKIAQKCGKSVSIADPLLDAALPDGSRVQCTMGTDIARRGSNFTIRKFTSYPLTPTHMLHYKTVDSLLLAYLWMAIENGKSILISGGTATGKTSLLNALSLFIRPNLKILSIEDTPELRLPHTHWVPEVARSPLSVKGKIGEVTLFDLLKSSLRQRPDYLVVGEVRGKEAFVLFQQMASIPGDEKVMVLNDNHLRKVGIAGINDFGMWRVPTVDTETGRMLLSPLKAMIEHRAADELCEIETGTGRRVMTTKSHSVFTYRDGRIEPAVVGDLGENDNIIIPAYLPSGYDDIGFIDLVEMLPEIRVYSPKLIRKAAKKLGFKKASEITGYACISHYYGVNNCALPAGKFKKLMNAAGIKFDCDDIKVRFERGKSPLSPPKIEINPELLRLMGYYIAEGSINRAYRNNTISLYSMDEDVLNDMRKCIKSVTGKKARERVTRGFGECVELSFNDKTICELLKRCCGHGSAWKKVPSFIFGLSKRKIAAFMSGLYAGDSYMSEDTFAYYTISKELADDVSTLLLSFGIVASVRSRKREGRKSTDYEIVFHRNDDKKNFLRWIKPAGKNVRIKGKSRHNTRKIVDVYVDKIKSIKRRKLAVSVPVYDLSVPGTQNFIGGFGGILLHNTGHPSLATIHAASLNQLIDRLVTPPISLPPALLENIDIIVFLQRMKIKGRTSRRTSEVIEITGIKDDRPVSAKIFQWSPSNDEFISEGKSKVLDEIAHMTALTQETIQAEILRRKKVIEWMYSNNVYDYKEVGRIVSEYYLNPERVLSVIEESEQ